MTSQLQQGRKGELSLPWILCAYKVIDSGLELLILNVPGLYPGTCLTEVQPRHTYGNLNSTFVSEHLCAGHSTALKMLGSVLRCGAGFLQTEQLRRREKSATSIENSSRSLRVPAQ